MENQIIDLDVLTPQPKKVKLNGIIIDVYPVRINDALKIQKLDKGNLQAVMDVMESMIPDIKKTNPTIEQLTRLITYVTSIDNSEKAEESGKKKE